MRNLLSKEMIKKILMVLLCLTVALVSMFVVAKRATDPQSYKNTIQSIDDKKATVMGITTATITASTALAAIPGDATTPIANQIMDMGSYLLIVVFALVISTIIPFSLKISDLIYESNQSMVTELTDEVEKMDDSGESEKEKNWWESFTDKIKDGVANVGEKAKELVNDFIDVIALFIITYCAIPIIIFLIAIWFIKFLFNIKIPGPEKESLKLLNALKKSNPSNDDKVEK